MYCGNCGKKLDEGVAHCPECGAKIATEQNAKSPNISKDSLKVPKLSVATVAICLVAIVIVGVVVYQWYMSAEQRAIRAINEGDYNSVVVILAEDDTILESEKLSKKISERIANIRDRYIDNEIDYGPAIVELVMIEQLNVSGHSTELNEARQYIDLLNQSRTNFAAAESLYLSGDYIGAIEHYSLVIEDDANYSTGQDKISRAKDSYCADVLSKAAELAADELYEEAIVELENAFEYLDNDPELERQLQVYQKLYDAMEPIIVATGYWGDDNVGNVIDIMWVLDSKGHFTVSGTGSMESSLMSCPWADYRSSITMITIEDGVTNVGGYSFSGCSEVTSVSIPTSVTYIGRNAFSGCTKLTNIIIPNSVTAIGDFAFEDCSGLISLVIPDSVTTLSQHAFSGCSSLIHVTVPASVTKLGMGVFSGCSRLSSAGPIGGEYDFEYGWTSTIPENAFHGSQLTSISIQDSVTEIGSYAFACCSNLEKVTIPANVQKLGNNIYEPSSGSNYSDYKLVTAGPVGGGYNIEFGWADSIPAHAFDHCESLTRVELPDGVAEIGAYAFDMCRSLNNVVLPNSVTNIDSNAFSYCHSLSNISIPNSVTRIGGSAFIGCISLESITLPNSVTSLGIDAFAYSTNLTQVTLSSSLTSIQGTFEKCENLTSIFVPSSITNLGYMTFYGCNKLTDIYYSGTSEQWKQIHVSSDNGTVLNNVTVHYSSTAIRDAE